MLGVRGHFLGKGLGIGQRGPHLGREDTEIAGEPFGTQPLADALRHPLHGEARALDIGDPAPRRVAQFDERVVAVAQAFFDQLRPDLRGFVTEARRQTHQTPAHFLGQAECHHIGLAHTPRL